MLSASISPTVFEGKTITKLFVRIDYYDLKSRFCHAFYKAYNDNDGAYFVGRWQVPENVVQNWGSDDSVIIQALADDKNLTIISID